MAASSGRVVMSMLMLGCVGTVGEKPLRPSGSDAQGSCGTSNAPQAPLRFLTRTEYVATLAQLLAPDLLEAARPSELLPTDGSIGSFASNAASVINEPAAERYALAADAVARAVEANVPAALGCEPVTTCRAYLVNEWIPRAFRHPLDDATRDRWTNVFDTISGERDHVAAVGAVVRGALQSPFFLYHVERGHLEGGQRVLDGYELAAKLSYFIVGAPPDAPLREAAERGELATAQQLEEHARRLLRDDPRANESLTNFVLSWFGIASEAGLSKDAALYPQWTPQLLAAARAEARGIVVRILEDDADVGRLFTERESRVSTELASLYGLSSATNDGWQVMPQERSGLLTSVAFLATHSHPARSSPVLTGVFVRRELLCDALGEPPPDLDTEFDEESLADATLRERFAAHSNDPQCAYCHTRIDPIGFGFSRFDAIGRYDASVDASGSLAGTDVDGAFSDVAELSRRLSTSTSVASCSMRQLFRFSARRRETDGEKCEFEEAAALLGTSKGDLREIVVAIVTSSEFRMAAISCEGE